MKNRPQPFLRLPTQPKRDDQKKNASRRTVYITFSILLLVELAFAMLEAPKLRIFEQIIACRQHNQHDLAHFSEMLLSDDDSSKVQSELALIIGWGDTLSAAADILVAIPFGLLADRYGRRPILRLNLTGILLSSIFVLVVIQLWNLLPLRLVWVSAVFNFIGGGATVTTSLFFMIIADVSDEVQRISYFSLLAIAGLAGQVVGAPLASTLMLHFDPWVPLYVATIIIFVGASLSFFIPETLNHGGGSGGHKHARQPSALASACIAEKTPLISEFGDDVHDDYSKPPTERRRPNVFRTCTSKLQEGVSIMFQDKRVFLILATFPLHVISRQTMKLLLQYVTQRYSWSVADAAFLHSLRASVNILLLILILPLVTKLLLGPRFQFSIMRKDLTLAQASMALLTLGSFLISFSPSVQLLSGSLVIYTLGTGFALFVRSLATSLVKPDQVGRLYSAMTVFDAFGQMTAGPLLAEIFHLGLERSKAFSGLPFLVGGILHAAVLGLVSCIRLPEDQLGRQQLETGNEQQGLYVIVQGQESGSEDERESQVDDQQRIGGLRTPEVDGGHRRSLGLRTPELDGGHRRSLSLRTPELVDGHRRSSSLRTPDMV